MKNYFNRKNLLAQALILSLAVGTGATAVHAYSAPDEGLDTGLSSTAVGGGTASGKYSVSIGTQPPAKGAYSIVIGSGENAGSFSDGSIVVGYRAHDSILGDSEDSIVIGNAAKTTGKFSFAIGKQASTYKGKEGAIAFGVYTSAKENNSVALGAYSTTGYDRTAVTDTSVGAETKKALTHEKELYLGEVSVGAEASYTDNRPFGIANSKVLTRRISHVADAVNDLDAVNLRTLKAALAANGGSEGTSGEGVSSGGVMVSGEITDTNENAVSGKTIFTKLSNYATKTELDNKLDTSDAASTYATKTELGNKLDTSTAESTYAKKMEFEGLQKSVEMQSAKVKDVSTRVVSLEDKTDRLGSGVANAIAIASIPQVRLDQTMSFGVGFGNYDGKSSVAIGLSGKSGSNLTYKFSGAFSNGGHVAIGAGLSFGYGHGTGIVENVDNQQVAEMKAKVEQLQREVAMLMAMVKQGK